jgi:DNA-binding CsgD family transcriptional regulator
MRLSVRTASGRVGGLYGRLAAVSKDETRRRPVDLAPTKRKPEPRLVYVSPAGGEPEQLAAGSTVIGRDTKDLQIENDGLSREHAKVVVASDGQVTVLDLNSTNGTYVNATRVEFAPLREGDVLQLGPDVVFSFTRLRPEAEAQREAAARAREKLTPRELDVAKLVARGLTSPQIAEQLGIGLRTVTSHLDHIYTRFGISSRAALASWVTSSGLLEDAE